MIIRRGGGQEISVIDLDLLIKAKIVSEKSARRFGVKILFDKKITKKLTIKDLPVSAAAAELFKKPASNTLDKPR